MIQQGQVFKLGSIARDGGELWAYRYRTGGRNSKRVQHGGFRSDADARAALERALEKHRRGHGVGRRLTLAEFVHNFRNRNWKPAQHAVGIEPFRRIYDLRHTFATFALRAGISTFELPAPWAPA